MNKLLKILLLEDSVTDAEIVQRLLKKTLPVAEFCLVMHKNEFLRCLDEFKPDIILSDNALPQFSATEALQIVNDRDIHIPFIMVTGTVSEEFAANIIKSGADDYILKDRIARLPAAIEAALLKRKTEKEIADYKYALDQSSIVSITDEKGIIKYANKIFCNASGYTLTELLGSDHRIVNSGYHPKEYIKHLWDTISSGKIWQGEFCNKNKDGSIYWVDATIIPFLNGDGRPYQYLAIRSDITQRKNAEAEVKLMEREISDQIINEQKKITHAIIAAQEKERTGIGRELHDNVSQMLGAIHLYIDMAKTNDESRDSLLTDASRFTLEAIQEIRKLTKTLITPLMQEIGLQDVIQDLIKQIMTVHPIQIIFTTHNFIEDSVSDKFKLNIFRIIQEQLNNILKHAKAQKVQVNITENENKLLLTVADDGIGFDTAIRSTGVGVTNIKSRCELYHGNMKLNSAPGKGTVLSIDFNKTDILIQQDD